MGLSAVMEDGELTKAEKIKKLQEERSKILAKFGGQEDDSPYTQNIRTGVACDRLRYQLKACLLESECCWKDRRTPKECLLMRHPSVPLACYELRSSFSSCKRSMIDPRARMRGRKGDHS